jgi:hypothetical protein
LRDGIASSDRFVLIASEASAANLYVQLEVSAALAWISQTREVHRG